MHATGCGLLLCASCRKVISGIEVKETVRFHCFSVYGMRIARIPFIQENRNWFANPLCAHENLAYRQSAV